MDISAKFGWYIKISIDKHVGLALTTWLGLCQHHQLSGTYTNPLDKWRSASALVWQLRTWPSTYKNTRHIVVYRALSPAFGKQYVWHKYWKRSFGSDGLYVKCIHSKYRKAEVWHMYRTLTCVTCMFSVYTRHISWSYDECTPRRIGDTIRI
jgi:gamma-glutamylcysteine synthetase